MSPVEKKKKVEGAGLVLALGGGGARGLAHIGVIQMLEENAIPIRDIAGTSIGAEIGAFIAAGMPIQELAAIATSFDWKDTLQLFMPDLPTGGLVSGVNIMDFLQSRIGSQRIEDLEMGYAAIATDLETCEQMILDSGSLVAAVRASISVPGLIAPYQYDHCNLVDGGVVNPLPFDVARDRFGGPVVAVAVHASAAVVQPVPQDASQWPLRIRQLLEQPWMERAPAMRAWLVAQLANAAENSIAKPEWTTRHVIDRAMGIMETELVRLRGAICPPDLMFAPEVADIGMIEFYRAEDAIAAGRRAAEAHLPALRQLARTAQLQDAVS
jgi:NTE family protein